VVICLELGADLHMVELGRYRFFKVGFRFFGRFFQKSVSVSVFQNIAISVSVFRTNLPLLIE